MHGAVTALADWAQVSGRKLPVLARRAAQSGRFDAVVCLGAVIRGATPHFDYVAAEAAIKLLRSDLPAASLTARFARERAVLAAPEEGQA